VVEGVKVTCKGDECLIPTRSTSLNGIEVEFWASQPSCECLKLVCQRHLLQMVGMSMC
jgi:hypothetical protein